MKSKLDPAALCLAVILSLTMVDQAFAGFVSFTPPVPEIDGPAGIAAIALLMGVVATLYQKIRK